MQIKVVIKREQTPIGTHEITIIIVFFKIFVSILQYINIHFNKTWPIDIVLLDSNNSITQ